MLREEKLLVEDMLETIKDLKSFTQKKSLSDFKKDKILKKAVLYCLIVLGEASGVLRKKYNYKNEILFEFLKQNRNKLTHRYWISDEKNQWDLINVELPKIEKIMKEKLNQKGDKKK